MLFAVFPFTIFRLSSVFLSSMRPYMPHLNQPYRGQGYDDDDLYSPVRIQSAAARKAFETRRGYLRTNLTAFVYSSRTMTMKIMLMVLMMMMLPHIDKVYTAELLAVMMRRFATSIGYNNNNNQE